MMIPCYNSHLGSKTPLQSFLGIAEQHTAHNGVRFFTVPVFHILTHHPRCLQPPLKHGITYTSAFVFLSEQCVPVRQSSQPHSHHS